jgi:hypothetical protein
MNESQQGMSAEMKYIYIYIVRYGGLFGPLELTLMILWHWQWPQESRLGMKPFECKSIPKGRMALKKRFPNSDGWVDGRMSSAEMGRPS